MPRSRLHPRPHRGVAWACAVIAAMLAPACGAAPASPEGPAGGLPWRDSFDACRDGQPNALQWQSGVRLAYGATLAAWEHAGSHAVHVAERGGSVGRAVLLWQEDRLTLRDPLEANVPLVRYRLSCDVAPAVYATPDQATGPEDGVVVEIVRGDGTVLAAATFLPGPWQGLLRFRRHALEWTGDGGGAVRVVFRPRLQEGRFAGAIDEVSLERVADPGAEAGADGFEARVAPLLASRCLECHRGPASEGGLDLSTAAGLAAGGESGAAVAPGDPPSSLLWQRVAAGEMPPGHPLDDAERATLEAWIAAGAPWSGGAVDPFRRSSATRAGADFWSLQPLTGAQVPEVAGAWPRNDIDRFVLDRLRREGLEPAPPAAPRDLVRRLWIDVTGLPPDPEEVRAFERDPSDEAWERLVDRLLGSLEHAERMARHWLDAVRFGESDGYEHNAPRDHAWQYRDWVIRAFQADLRYDDFVRLQVAGDVLVPGTLDGIAATGFLVAGVHNPVVGASPAMREAARQDELEEIAGTVAQTFLGLSVNCARCHDHKYDPVPTEDYYAFAAALAGVRHGTREAPGPDGGPVPVYGVVSGPAEAVHVLARGDVRKPGAEVVPAGLRALSAEAAEFGVGPGSDDAGRRRLLAAWLTGAAEGPLARVAANRVWQWHFGRGIVDTPGDLGFNGGRPSHPELLEWLAARLRDEGWSLRALHRLVLTSSSWRMASAVRPEGERIDRGNRLLWRQHPRRVEGEVFRDAMLSCAGLLTGERSGPGYRDVTIREVPPTHYYLALADGAEPPRRTIYRFAPRGSRSGLLDTFDCPDPSARTPQRGVTTTPGQVLSQWNSATVLRAAEAAGRRLEAEVAATGPGDDVDTRRVERAWWLALGRAPEPDERAAAVGHLRRHGAAALFRVLFNTNEFVVIP